jgi:hypothetical protein
MTQVEKQIMFLTLLKSVQHPNETPTDTILRALENLPPAKLPGKREDDRATNA